MGRPAQKKAIEGEEVNLYSLQEEHVKHLVSSLTENYDKVAVTFPPLSTEPTHPFIPGDRVLIKQVPGPIYQGPFEVLKATRTAILTDQGPQWIHASRIKKAPSMEASQGPRKKKKPSLEASQGPQKKDIELKPLPKPSTISTRKPPNPPPIPRDLKQSLCSTLPRGLGSPRNIKQTPCSTLPKGLRSPRDLRPNDIRVIDVQVFPPGSQDPPEQPWKCTTQIILVFAILVTFEIILITTFVCWMTNSCNFQLPSNYTNRTRRGFMGNSNYPCCTQIAGQMSKAQSQAVTGYHIQRRDGNCHIAAIVFTAKYKGVERTWCMDPNHKPSQSLVSKFKKAKLRDIGISQVIQNKRSNYAPFAPLNDTSMKKAPKSEFQFLESRRELLRPDFRSINNGAQLNPETYSVPGTSQPIVNPFSLQDTPGVHNLILMEQVKTCITVDFAETQ